MHANTVDSYMANKISNRDMSVKVYGNMEMKMWMGELIAFYKTIQQTQGLGKRHSAITISSSLSRGYKCKNNR